MTQLPPGALVSADSRKATYGEWKAWSLYLSPYRISMVIIPENLVDSIWENRPVYPTDPIKIQEESFAGESWQSKISRLRYTLSQLGADMQIVTALDEIAWLLNLRGSDIPYTPVFRAYLTVGLNWATLYLPLEKITPLIRSHLYTATDNVLVMPYDWIWYDLPERAKRATKVLVPSLINYSKGASFLIYQMIPSDKILLLPSPVVNMKAYKNSVEAEGMKNAHIRDAVAFCELWFRMENGLKAGEKWDELKVVAMLEKLRGEQPFNRGPSFQSIVAFGSNGALPHYIPSFTTNKVVDNSSLLTIDSGGQYLDGTIDTTRMLHFGTPTSRQIEIYTTLLKGCIDLVTTVFPAGATMQQLDFIIRRPLYQLGLDYGHGSTHGIGYYLGVHESFNYTYDINFFGSQEPGYYKENDFGMRLENIVRVIRANNLEKPGREFFTFEPITLVPYEKKLINYTMLDRKQVKWLNNYYAKIRDLVGDEMIKQGRQYLYKWLIEKTNPICLYETQ